MQSIKRNIYLQRLIDREHNGLVKIITGIRRCGKSYLLNSLFYSYLLQKGVSNDHIIKLAFDEEDSSDLLISSNLNDDFKKVIIVKDDIKHKIDENGIVVMGIFDFLMTENSLD